MGRPLALLLSLFFFGTAALSQGTQDWASTETQAFRDAAAVRYRAILAGLRERRALDDDDAARERARRIAAGLIIVAAAERPDTTAWSWEVHVTSDPAQSAFCMAGGKVLVGSVLVRRLALDDGELAMLLGHEMAHALAGHRREVARGSIDADAVAGVRQADVAMAQEVEADRIGMRLAYRAGWPIASLVSFYDKLAAAEQPGTFNSSHPSAVSRAALARAMAAKLGD
jgi:predicted Zn-dependent protease